MAFFATSHGKGPCDGVGGSVKRLAASASLQRPFENQIQTPEDLYKRAKSCIPNNAFAYVSSQEVEEEALLNKRFELACRVPRTQQLHSSAPSQTLSHLQARPFSTSTKICMVKVSSVPSNMKLSWDKIYGYITCRYEDHWWLAYIIDKNPQKQEVLVKFFHPAGP